jgi:hypothetical protein
MTVRLTEVTHTDLEYICFRMRECDKAEIFNLRHYDNPYQLAWECASAVRTHGRGQIAWWDGRPAAIFAFTCTMHPNLWEIWMFGTDHFRSVAFDLIRWCRKEANEILTVQKAHRLQADARVGHEDAHKFIRALGGRPEVTLEKYGKDGGDYIRYVWINGRDDAVLKPHFTRAA